MDKNEEMNNGVKSDQLKIGGQYTLNGVNLNPRHKDLLADNPYPLSGHFTYHKPTPEQIPCYNAINEAARTLADTIARNTPPGADQTAAIRLVVQAKMTANSAIATHPEHY